MAISAVCKPAKLPVADADRVHDKDVWPYSTPKILVVKTPVRSRCGLLPKPAPVVNHRTFLESWWPGG